MKTLIEYTLPINQSDIDELVQYDKDNGFYDENSEAIAKETVELNAFKQGLEGSSKMIQSAKSRFESYWALQVSDEVVQAIKDHGFTGFAGQVANSIVGSKKISDKQLRIIATALFNHKF